MTHAVLQATIVALAVDQDGPLAGLCFLGPSGAGKSSLALALVEGCPFSRSALVADDVALIYQEGEKLLARAPERIAGLIEIRGYGPAPVRTIGSAELLLALDLAAASGRMPQVTPLQPVNNGPQLPSYPFRWKGEEALAAFRVRRMAAAILSGRQV